MGRVISVVSKQISRKTLAEVAHAIVLVTESSSDFTGPAFNVFVVVDETVKKNAPLDPSDLLCKSDLGPSAPQRIQELCRNFSLSVSPDVCSD